MREFLQELMYESGNVITRYYQKKNIHIDEKENKTPVTAADKEAEKVIRGIIEKRFPDHGIIGEEFGNKNEKAEYVWVIDPIDGTLAFIHGVPLFVTLIALLKNGEPILGAIHQPIAKLLCDGNNQEAWLNNEPVRMRQFSGFSQATLLCTDMINIGRFHNKAAFDELVSKVKLFRTWGDGFGYLLLASGKADIMLDARMAPWDILPVIPVVRGAGAAISSFSGQNAVISDSAICAHPSIHGEILQSFQAKR